MEGKPIPGRKKRQFIPKHSSLKSREINNTEQELTKEINKLEIAMDENEVKINEDRLNTARIKLEQLRENKLKGYKKRSRYQHNNEWEKPYIS